jgi:hypothetical protein
VQTQTRPHALLPLTSLRIYFLDLGERSGESFTT